MSKPLPPTLNEVVVSDFIAREAALLDEGCLDDWLALFAEDGAYWVPKLGRRVSDELGGGAAAYEDRSHLTQRVEQMKDPIALAQQEHLRCQHVLQTSRIEEIDIREGTATVRTPFLYIESHGEQKWMLAGSYRHVLVQGVECLRIRQKRVDLLAADRALPEIQLFI